MNKKNIIIVIGLVIIAALGYCAFVWTSSPTAIEDMTTATTTAPQGKININAVCDGVLAYMTFTDSASADIYVAECKEGKHPEVIEHYKAQMNLGAGATI